MELWDYTCPKCNSDDIDAVEYIGHPIDTYILWKCITYGNKFKTVMYHEVVDDNVED